MRTGKPTTEHLIYWLAFLLALFLRLFQLGAGALSDVEAGWALQALALAHGQAATLGAQPAYIILTSQLFSIISDSNFLARLYPALAGSLLVWLPFFFRRQMAESIWLHRAGLVLAFGLAIDPGLVSLSRQVGSSMPAMAFTLLALACLYNRRMLWVGIFAGLALLSGPAFLQGVLILGLSYGLIRLVDSRKGFLEPDEDVNPVPPESISVEEISPRNTSRSISLALVAFGATLLVAGTLFLHFPQGLGGLAETIPAYLRTWIHPSGIPVLRLPGSLLVYQPLILIFAIIAIVRTLFGEWNGDQYARRVMLGLGVWSVIALLVPLFYVGRQVGDMAWALIPLWALAASEISRAISPGQDKATYMVSAGLLLLLFVLAVVGWFNLLSIGRYQVNVLIYWAIIIGALLLGFIAVLLVAAAWSSSAARLGVVWSVCLVLGLLMISSTCGVASVRQNSARELWSVPATTGQADELNLTLSDLSKWNTGLKDQIEIVSLVDSPALKWALRHFPNAHFETSLSATASPPVVITLKDAELPSLAQNYRGQDFNWLQYPGWQGAFPPDFINWLAFRQAPVNVEQVILWARADAFPGGTLNNSESPAP